MKFQFILQNHRVLAVEKMCQFFGVSRSGYYCWVNKKTTPREKKNKLLVEKIREIFNESKMRYGAPKVYIKLKKAGISAGLNLVARLMRENEMRSKVKKKFKITTHSKHNHQIAPDLLKRNFKANKENRVWVADITYIWTMAGWVYLAMILDVYSRKIVGWSLSDRLKTAVVIEAFNKAVNREKPSSGLIFHSDKGSQYACGEFKKELGKNKMIQSMGKNGSYDNAMAESFFHLLKTELVYGTTFASREMVNREVFEYIEVFYNRERPHSGLGGLSPEEYLILNKIA